MSIFQIAKEQSQRASDYGFDWDSTSSVMQKVFEETQELHIAISNDDRDEIQHEIGDVLLALVSLARHSDISLEQAFCDAIQRFQVRWDKMQKIARLRNITLETQSPSEWESLWENAKTELDRRA